MASCSLEFVKYKEVQKMKKAALAHLANYNFTLLKNVFAAIDVGNAGTITQI